MTPKYIYIKDNIIGKIRDGTYVVGDKLPSEKKLSEEFNVHHTTAAKALRALAEDGYVSSRPGSGNYVNQTRSPKTGNIALIVNDINSPFYGELVKQVQKYARKSAYHLLLHSTSEDFDEEKRYISDTIDKNKADGFLVVSSNKASDRERSEFYLSLENKEIPFVLIFPPGTCNDTFNCVLNDNEDGTFRAAEFLYTEKGHTRIGFVGHSLPNNSIQQNSLKGFRHALKKYRLEFNSNSLIKIPFPSIEHGMSAADEIIAMKEDAPTAFFAVSEILQIGMIMRFRERHLMPPLIIGSDATSMRLFDNFKLLTMDNQLDIIAEKATALLLKNIFERNNLRPEIRVKQKLVIH